MEEVEVILWYGQHMEKAHLAVTNLGWQTVIIGHSWLTHHNPEVDWAHQSVTMSQCPCHGTPRPHAPPNHLQSSPTPSAYTPVSLRCTLCKLTQPCHSCGRTKLRSMSNFPGLSPYVSGRHLFVFFSICCICLMHFH